jgi:hypothetical protein
MGVYDHIRCDYRLPNGKVGVEDQTKEFRNFFYDHVIDAEGQLWIDDGRNEEVPKDERPYPDAPDGSFEAFIGSSRHIQKLVKADDYYGAIEIDDYILLFRAGKLLSVDVSPYARKRQIELDLPAIPEGGLVSPSELTR